jgi:hypothetical protein
VTNPETFVSTILDMYIIITITVHTCAALLLVPEGIVRIVVGASTLTWFIRFSFWNLQFLSNALHWNLSYSPSAIGKLCQICLSCLGPFVYLLPVFLPDEGYSSNASCTLNYWPWFRIKTAVFGGIFVTITIDHIDTPVAHMSFSGNLTSKYYRKVGAYVKQVKIQIVADSNLHLS